jgi:hypothetical protein
MGKFKRRQKTKDCPICTMRHGEVMTKEQIQNPKLIKERDICWYRKNGECTFTERR